MTANSNTTTNNNNMNTNEDDTEDPFTLRTNNSSSSSFSEADGDCKTECDGGGAGADGATTSGDWTLYVCHRETPNIVASYTIHEAIVGTGPKGSRYLANIMQNIRRQQQQHQSQDQQPESDEKHLNPKKEHDYQSSSSSVSSQALTYQRSPRLRDDDKVVPPQPQRHDKQDNEQEGFEHEQPRSSSSSSSSSIHRRTRITPFTNPLPFIILELNQEQARAIPLLLDFMYFYRSPTPTTTTAMDDTSKETTHDYYYPPRRTTTKTDNDSKEDYNEDEEEDRVLLSNGTDATFYTLYRLAQQWEIPAFLRAAAKFQQKRLSKTNILTILAFASQGSLFTTHNNNNHNNLWIPTNNQDHCNNHNNDPLLEATLDWCAAHLHEFKVSSSSPTQDLVAQLEPEHLLQILHKNKRLGVHIRIDDFCRSALVARCLQNNANRALLTQDLLHQLTDEELLPFIGPRWEAPIFLLVQAQLLIHKGGGSVQSPPRSSFCSMDGTIKGMYSGGDGRDSVVRELSSLEQRCIQSISTYWQTCYTGFCRPSHALSLLSSFSSSRRSSSSSLLSSSSTSVSSSSMVEYDFSSSFWSMGEKSGKEAFLEFLHELPLSVLVELLERSLSSSSSSTWNDSGKDDDHKENTAARILYPQQRKSPLLQVLSSRATLANMLFQTIQPLLHEEDDTTVLETDDEASCRVGGRDDEDEEDSLLGLIGGGGGGGVAIDSEEQDSQEGESDDVHDHESGDSLLDAANRLLNRHDHKDLDPFFVELYYDTMPLTTSQAWI
jgi:hypothetical protein